MLPAQATDATKEIKVKPHKTWIEQCEAAKGIEDEFGNWRTIAVPMCLCECTVANS